MDIKYNNEKYSVELEKIEEGYKSLINKEDSGLLAKAVNKNSFIIKAGDKKYNVYAASDEKHHYVSVDGYLFTFDKPQEEESEFAGAANDANSETIITPMPGSVVKVLVEEGQQVEEGQGLIIVEAMKMESTLYASISGVVAEVNVKQGDQVDSDVPLIIVEKEEK